jgi:hypothetical protein
MLNVLFNFLDSTTLGGGHWFIIYCHSSRFQLNLWPQLVFCFLSLLYLPIPSIIYTILSCVTMKFLFILTLAPCILAATRYYGQSSRHPPPFQIPQQSKTEPSPVAITGADGRPYFSNGSSLGQGAPDDGVAVQNFTFGAGVAGSGANRRPARSPVVVNRNVDSASPVLLNSMVNGLALTEVRVISVFESNGTAAGTGESTTWCVL